MKSIPALLVVLLLAVACGEGSAASPPPESAGPVVTTAPPTTVGDTAVPSTSTTIGVTTTTQAPLDPPTFESLDGINTIPDFAGYTDSGLSRWEGSVPGVEDVIITSTADGSDQPALWLAPDGEGERPLLVILHSWSAPYEQHAGIPYAMWAQENGWAVIAPQFRGVNDNADAIGSDLAVQDVVDAIDFATSQGGVDARRTYAVGYSGGGMMSLLLAGRHPDKVTAVAAWGPPYDLIDFYGESISRGSHYWGDIEAGCGDDPTADAAAEEECLRRSPSSHLDKAREEGVPVLIAQGISDQILPPSQGAHAFNQLAAEEDRLSEEQIEVFAQGTVPEDLADFAEVETYFGEGDPAPVFARQSGPVLLVFFDADHDMAYQASLRFFASDPG